MKTTHTIILLLILCLGCNEQRGHSHLRKKHPDEEIIAIPGHNYEYIIRTTNGEILHAVSDGASVNGDNTQETKLLGPQQLK